MNKLIIYSIFLILIGSGCSKTRNPELAGVDYYIRNASIVDGTGKPAYNGFVAISGNRIARVSEEEFTVDPGAIVIDANGKILSPGFIDLHAHGNPASTPDFENFLAMGVTTISLGQDGSSPNMADLGTWQEQSAQQGLGVNIAMFIGHGTLRELSGTANKPIPTTIEMDSMVRLLERNKPYIFGMSLGLEYAPGIFAHREELNMLARYLGKDRMIMSHMRNEDDSELMSSIKELAEQGAYTKVHVSHLKSVYGKGVDRADQILDLIYSLRLENIDITADVYPYTASYTGISIVFPEWSKTPQQFEDARKNRRAELEEYLENRIKSRNGPAATLFGTPPYAGKTLEDLQKEWNISIADILIDSIGPHGASAAYFVMDESLQDRLITDSLIAICSDGSPTGYHPRGHGTYARIIEDFVRKRKILTLEDAIHKMTGYPAQILGLGDRGIIREGYFADLVLFNPADVKELATYENPFQNAEGFELVFVNGTVARQEGTVKKRNGKFLKKDE